MKKLYTFVVDYQGGTYISQIENESDSPYNIFKDWVKTCDFLEIISKRINRNKLIDKIEKFEKVPLPLDNLNNVWCITLILLNKLALINIIKTDRSP
ncbi:MAG: hypothetical protein FWD70_08000 [Desulfuromonadales bacterium]|nr:hypothetical protein [Desulfuromonadales bacterium]